MTRPTTTMNRPPKVERQAPIDPRIRRRRVEVRRDQGRRRLRVLAVALCSTVLTVAGWLTTRSSILDVDHIEVRGAVHIDAAEVAGAARIRPGAAMVDIEEQWAERRIERLPWVAGAWVERQWPNRILIEVTERQPVAAVPAAGGGWAVVDRTSWVMELTAERPALIAIEGAALAPAPGRRLERGSAGLVAVAEGVPTSIKPRVDAVVAATGGHVDLRVRSDSASVTIRLGPPDRLGEKFMALEAVLAGVDSRGLATIDLRLPETPVVTRK